MTIFIYSSSVTSETCSMNPNYCTILFRSVLWFTVVVALAVIKSDRRGGRIDWAVAIILSIGISLLLWNHSVFIYLPIFDSILLFFNLSMYSLFSYFFLDAICHSFLWWSWYLNWWSFGYYFLYWVLIDQQKISHRFSYPSSIKFNFFFNL